MATVSSSLLERASRFLGYGDVESARVWFVGLEEALSLDDPDTIPTEAFETYQGCAGSRTSVYVIISKVITGLRGREWKTEWRDYRDYRLFSPNSEAVQANLSPLGKPSTKVWLDQYESQFGFSLSQYWYRLENDEWSRFAHLRQLRGEHGNPLTICFGKGWWDTFASALDLDADYVKTRDPFRLYHVRRVVMTPFFAPYTGMSNAKVEALLNLIKNRGLTPSFDSTRS